MQRESEDEAWRAIVENYGDRPELDDEPPAGTATDPASGPASGAAGEEGPQERLERLFRPLPQPAQPDAAAADDPEDRFEPPTPPPVPKAPPDRLAAWTGLFGAPTVLLVCLVVGISLPAWLGYLLVAAFIGGFIYLVVQLPAGPADPWDDGARL